MFAGVSRHQDRNYFFYEGVIPNSQLIFLPYQPEHVQDSSSWKVELYIQPADYVPWVLIVLAACAVILGIVVAVLRTMERREDEMERRKALHIINFDAL
jgi:integrin alpha FG-GAP repeat containing protein 1